MKETYRGVSGSTFIWSVDDCQVTTDSNPLDD